MVEEIKKIIIDTDPGIGNFALLPLFILEI